MLYNQNCLFNLKTTHYINDFIQEKISGEWGEDTDGKSGTKIIRTTNFTNNGFINFTNIVERLVKAEIIQNKKLCLGDIIIEKSGGSPSQPVGRVVFFNKDDDTYLCNNFTTVLRPKTNVFPKYLFYQLFYLHLTKRTLRYQNKTTGILNLKLDRYLNEEKISVPDFPTQQHIAQTLEAADKARQQRKEANELTEQFLQSTFLHLFGDPVKNEKGWEKMICNKLFEMKLGKMLDAKKITGDHLKSYLRNANVQWGRLDLSELKQMDFPNNDAKIFSLRRGDILVCEGGEVGRTCIFNLERTDLTFQKSLHRLRIKEPTKITPEYFLWLMRIGVARGMIKRETMAVTIQHFTLEKFREFAIPLPPLSLQQHFASIVAETEKLRQKQRESEQELEHLFQSLLQQYFGNAQSSYSTEQSLVSVAAEDKDSYQ